MPTQSLLPFVDSPDGPSQNILISDCASVPGPCSTVTPHSISEDKVASQASANSPLTCMFCEQTFAHQDELGPHVLARHPTMFSEPTVLRVEAEFRIPGQRHPPKSDDLPLEKDEASSCIVCGHTAQEPGELEIHMRKHKDYFTYCCNVCGRRFREPWFLKNHMKMHVKPGPKSKAQQDLDAPATINGIVQDAATDPVGNVYKMCMVCGFFFPDHDSLAEHSKVHNREAEAGKDEDWMSLDTDAGESSPKQEVFLSGLKLQSTSSTEKNERSSKWIAQLDPFNTYQAWQLATRGKIAVGFNNTKDISQEVSTDNEDCGSDKEEFNTWPEGQGEKTAREPMSRELRSHHQQQQTVTGGSHQLRRSLIQKHTNKHRPTTCEECRRTFRTYHQLVLHSRVHKRERVGEESPTSAVDSKPLSSATAEQTEEVFEERMDEDLILGEDGFDRSKVRSKECSYCGKSFRSSYYLTVHLRTHTGEKPYKCAYCDYAAAQKTSLKYHMDRRHKDKPFVEIFSRPASSAPSPDEEKRELPVESRALKTSKLWVPEATACKSEEPEKLAENQASDLNNPSSHFDELEPTATSSAITNSPVVCPAGPKQEILVENPDTPLNLSLKVSISVGADADPKYRSTPLLCSFCSYTTLYPEVLMLHVKLTHKDKLESTKKTYSGCRIKRKRHTGCPPALEGKDVDPLQVTDRRHPRRTKSPPPPAVRAQEGTPPHPPPAPKLSPIHAPRQEVVQENPHHRQLRDRHVPQEPGRYTELLRTAAPGSSVAVDRRGPVERVGAVDRSYATRSGAVWHSDVTKLCLSSRFGSFPQIDLGEPSSGKRLKLSAFGAKEAESGEKSNHRGPPADGANRIPMTGKTANAAAQGAGPATPAEGSGGIRTTPASLGSGLNSDWGMMNLLRSCTPGDLASLYRSTSTNPSHGGLAHPRPAGRSMLYQHLSGLPNLQMREPPSASYPSQRYGTADKSS